MSAFTNAGKFFDKILSPPPDYSNHTYLDRLGEAFSKIISGKYPVRLCFALVRLGAMVLFSYIFIPVAAILRACNYHFINIDLSQIGSVIYLDLLLRENAITYRAPKHKLLALASEYSDGNRYLLDLYTPHVTFIRNPFIKALLSPFFMSPVFQDNSYRFGLVHHTQTVSHQIWNDYMRAHDHKPLITFPENDKAEAQDLLSKYIGKDQKFVALHVRDNGFYGIDQQTTRNADIRTYHKAITYLIQQGYAVIRIGDAKMVDINDMIKSCGPMLFDYAHSDIKSEMMDCYLLSHCEFFIGLASGPASVPPVFHVNSCNINWCSAPNGPNFIEGDLTTFKKYRYQSNGALIAFADLLKPPFANKNDDKFLQNMDIILEDNSEDEILGAVQEFVENKGKITARQQEAAQLVNYQNYAFGARGYFSDTILRSYDFDGPDDTPPKYSICMCNYNMADTLERALSSIIDQLDNRFEIIVADDGSSDDSLAVLGALQKKYSCLRILPLARDPNRKLGYTRNACIRAARGEFVLLNVDCDDIYGPYIIDFIEVFHQIERAAGHRIYLSGGNINIGHKEFLLQYGPYRNIFRGEDRDLWRRLAADNAFISLKHKNFVTRLPKERTDRLYRIVFHSWDQMLFDFRTGMGLRDFLRYEKGRKHKLSFALWVYRKIILLPVFLSARFYAPLLYPNTMKSVENFAAYREHHQGTYPEIMAQFDCQASYDTITKDGRDIFA